MSLIRVDPFWDTWSTSIGDFDDFPERAWRQMSRALDNAFNDMTRDWNTVSKRSNQPRGVWRPRMDVYDGGNDIVAKLELPGINKEDVHIDLRPDGSLAVTGESKNEHEEHKGSIFVQERKFGRFQRLIGLPPDADTEKVTATYSNGVLEIHIQKKAEEQARRITVE